MGTIFSATSRAKFLKSEHRPGNDIELYQILLRSVSVLSGKAAGFAGQAAPCLQQKYYIADHSIREAVFDGTSQDINLILENIVFLELLRRGYEVTVGRTGDMDIDFVCDKRSEKLYVQVAYLLSIGRNCSGAQLMSKMARNSCQSIFMHINRNSPEKFSGL